MSRSHCITAFLACVMLFHSESASQNPVGEMRTFTDRKGENEFRAKFVELDGTTVRLLDESGESLSMKLNQLSLADQNWIKAAVKAEKELLKVQAEMEKVAEKLSHGNQKQQLLSVVKLREFGLVAQPYLQQVRQLAREGQTEDLRVASIITALAICPKNDQFWQDALTLFEGRQPDELSALSLQATPLLAALATFDSQALPYLKYVAHTGRLEYEDMKSLKAATLQTLDSAVGPANQVRSAAVLAMGNISTRGAPNDATIKALADDLIATLLRILSRAEVKVNGQQDQSTIEACLISLSKVAYSEAQLRGVLNRYEKINKEWATATRNRLRAADKMRREETLASRAQRTRVFTVTTPNGVAQLAAEFVRVENGNVRLLNEKNEVVVVPLTGFSKTDQEWIQKQPPSVNEKK